jgi:hypothetical protein
VPLYGIASRWKADQAKHAVGGCHLICCSEVGIISDDSNPRTNDFKIRYAFQDTQYYGAYMTDIIKRVEMKNSKDLLRHLKLHSGLVEQNIENFREELRDLNCTAPALIAVLAYFVARHLQPGTSPTPHAD